MNLWRRKRMCDKDGKSYALGHSLIGDTITLGQLVSRPCISAPEMAKISLHADKQAFFFLFVLSQFHQKDIFPPKFPFIDFLFWFCSIFRFCLFVFWKFYVFVYKG